MPFYRFSAIVFYLPLRKNTIALNEIVCLQIEEKSTAFLSLLGGERQMKPSPVDRTFDLLSNGMHNSFLTKMSLGTL